MLTYKTALTPSSIRLYWERMCSAFGILFVMSTAIGACVVRTASSLLIIIKI